MESNEENIIEYMKQFYPEIYAHLSGSGKLGSEQTFQRISSLINSSKSFHCGLDMSGLSLLLSTIKVERVALGFLDRATTDLYDEQLSRVDLMLEKGVTRNFKLPPHTWQEIEHLNNQNQVILTG